MCGMENNCILIESAARAMVGSSHVHVCMEAPKKGAPLSLGDRGSSDQGSLPEGGGWNLGRELSVSREKREKRTGAAAGEGTEWLTAKCLDFYSTAVRPYVYSSTFLCLNFLICLFPGVAENIK